MSSGVRVRGLMIGRNCARSWAKNFLFPCISLVKPQRIPMSGTPLRATKPARPGGPVGSAWVGQVSLAQRLARLGSLQEREKPPASVETAGTAGSTAPSPRRASGCTPTHRTQCRGRIGILRLQRDLKLGVERVVIWHSWRTNSNQTLNMFATTTTSTTK